MAKNIKSDAVPIPESKPECPEAPPPSSDKEEKKKKSTSESASSSDSDLDDSFTNDRKKRDSEGRPSTQININRAKDVHIGHKIVYAKSTHYTNQNYSTESDYGASSSVNENNKGPKPSEELLNSKREIDADDMYVVAENISTSWKKLARFLPPKNAFSEGQLKTFERDNPNNLVEAVIDMLEMWKLRYPENATLGVLAETLWNVGKCDISQKLSL